MRFFRGAVNGVRRASFLAQQQFSRRVGQAPRAARVTDVYMPCFAAFGDDRLIPPGIPDLWGGRIQTGRCGADVIQDSADRGLS